VASFNLKSLVSNFLLKNVAWHHRRL